MDHFIIYVCSCILRVWFQQPLDRRQHTVSIKRQHCVVVELSVESRGSSKSKVFSLDLASRGSSKSLQNLFVVSVFWNEDDRADPFTGRLLDDPKPSCTLSIVHSSMGFLGLCHVLSHYRPYLPHAALYCLHMLYQAAPPRLPWQCPGALWVIFHTGA